MIPFFKELYRRLNVVRVFDMAAQCAYYFLLSLFPFLLFVITLLGFLPFTSEQILHLITDLAPGATNQLIETNIRGIVDVRRSGLLSIGLLVTLWSTSAGMDSLIRTVNRAYEIRKERSFFRLKLLSVSLTFGMIFVILSALLLTVFGGKIEQLLELILHIPPSNVVLSSAFRWITNFVILLIVFSILYYVAPNTCLTCKDVMYGSIFAAIGWQVTSLSFSYYVNHFTNFSATYGSLGGVIVLMIWFYLAAFILITGGVINAILSKADESELD